MSVQRPRGPVQYVGPHEDDPMVARKYDVRSKFQEHSKDRGFVNHIRKKVGEEVGMRCSLILVQY